ncbi:uncharacterized protein N7459_001371 [Penicillium hispanicum]|uniref:uncharacterized protein n=1 Tax=Penicillium hispanicum TaxID=1080232 RepID=UPI00254237BA|nr:uncharacterized protein N7459_001371 [Penicillium hispanicum]KAJ5595163.1 hypothetical protein N7459_001371 [Penicillium hispanicum]
MFYVGAIGVCDRGRRGGKFQSISSSPPDPIPTHLTVIDCAGRYLCPGLFDAHVHLCATPSFKDLSKALGNPNDVHLLRQPYTAAQMLHRGFTSIRDCGGAQLSMKEAIDEGVFPGPRLFIAGHALSQFGGHGDLRGSYEGTGCCGGTHSNNHLGRLCNGVPECMAAMREEVRCGADFVKIIGNGRVASPTDKLEHLQFTAAEIQAMVECAGNAGTFVTAHAYTIKAIRHWIENGVKGIEYGNFVDAPTATLMAYKGVYLTPTLIVRADGVGVVEGISAAGVADEGLMYEFALRLLVSKPVEVLRSATVNPAKMMEWQDSIGQIKEGFYVDIVILNKNPFEDVAVFNEPKKYILGVIKDRCVYKSRRDILPEDSETPIRVKYN